MSRVGKRSIAIRGHRTSFSLEPEFLDGLRRMADERGGSFASLVAEIDAARPRESNLSSALRLAVLRWAMSGSGRAAPEEAGSAGRAEPPET